MHQDVHDVVIDLGVAVGFIREQDKLDAEERDENESGSHSPHVEAGLGLVRHSQLGDENPNDVQQEKQVNLEAKWKNKGL